MDAADGFRTGEAETGQSGAPRGGFPAQEGSAEEGRLVEEGMGSKLVPGACGPPGAQLCLPPRSTLCSLCSRSTLSPGFLGTDLPSLSFGELVGKFSAAPWGVVTGERAFTVFFPFSFSPPLSFLLAFPSLLLVSAVPGGGGVGAAEVAGSKAGPALPEGGPSEPGPPEVEGGAKATGNEPLLGARDRPDRGGPEAELGLVD